MKHEKVKTKVDELRDALKKKHETEEAPGPVSQEVKETKEETQGDALVEQIRAAEEEAKNHYDKLLRVMAEFENFKKRINKEHGEQLKFANEKLLREMLAPLDDLDRVHDHVPPDAAPELKQIADGIELAQKSLMTVLGHFGLREAEAAGAVFDPAMHEAIAAVESDAHEPNHIITVHRKGYWLYDRLIRPAMVTVAKDKSRGE